MMRKASEPKQWILYVGATILVVGALWWSFYHWREQRMSNNWMGPFLSAAQHLQPGKDVFLFDLEDVKQFKALDDVAEEDAYIFRQSASPEQYIYDPIGYPYLIKAATWLFPFVGHQLAIILFQCLVHLLLCLCILSERGYSLLFRILFLVLYALNPIILRFVTFNHYYFWQAIPSFLLLFVLLHIKNKMGWALLLLTLPFVLLARPTTLFTVMACLSLLFWQGPKLWTVVYTLLFISLVSWLYVPNQKNPWHTMYAGIGAYANPYGIELSDNSAYALYEKQTGQPLVTSTGGNYFRPHIQQQYHRISKEAYLTILQESPLLLIKNAVVNFFQAFSIGYINKASDWLNNLIALSGFIYFIILLYYRRFIIVGLIVATVVTFVPYYPPVQAYMYGNYLLLVWGLIEVVQESRLVHAVRSRNLLPL